MSEIYRKIILVSEEDGEERQRIITLTKDVELSLSYQPLPDLGRERITITLEQYSLQARNMSLWSWMRRM